MTRDEAAVCFARLVAHWPRLGGDTNDPLAISRATDWLSRLRGLPADIGMTAVDTVITEHREQRLPVFADVQEAARRIARHRAIEAGPKAIDAPKSRDIGLAGIHACRTMLDAHRGNHTSSPRSQPNVSR